MARTLMAHLPCLTITRSWVPLISYMRLLWSNVCICVFMLLFSFSIFSYWWSLKIENENNSRKNLTTEAPNIGLDSLEFSLYRNTLALTGTHFYGPKPVRATDVLLYNLFAKF